MHIITGMHRSGTSLIARLFFEAGADMGNPETFYKPDQWNPDGYYEQPDIHAINMPLINGMWWKFAYYDLPSTRAILRRAGRMSDEIKRTASEYHSRVVKETRFCLTLPAWLKQGAQVDRIIVCLREPIQVARSIQKRNPTLLKHAYYLWRVHNERILENAGQIPVWFLRYDNVLNEETYLREMENAFDFFGYELSEAELEALRQRCVRPTMNHFPDSEDSYSPEISALWKNLREQHASQFLSSVER